jgi:hypothetical protein
MDDEKYVTADYLIDHSFIQYKNLAEGRFHDIPFEDNPNTFHFREIDGDRQMFVVIISPYNGDPKDGYGAHVYVQIDAGCGFIEIPFPWWDLTIEYFESVYYGIRGYKPKLL